jgi:hypothetical protein
MPHGIDAPVHAVQLPERRAVLGPTGTEAERAELSWRDDGVLARREGGQRS